MSWYPAVYENKPERERGGETEKQTDRETERERERQKEKERERETDTEAETEREERDSLVFSLLYQDVNNLIYLKYI